MKKKHIYLIMLLLYGLFHTIFNIFWIDNNCLLPYFDPANHIYQSLQWYDALRNFSISSFLKESNHFPTAIGELLDLYKTYEFPFYEYNLFRYPSLLFLAEKFPLLFIFGSFNPPFVYLVASVIYSFIGTSYEASHLVISFFIFVLLLSIYGIGRELYNEEVGFYAAILSMLYPGVYLYSRLFFLEVPLTAMVSLSIFLLLKTNYFKSRLFSILFGASIGLGMLTKWTFAVFILGPLAYYIYKSHTSFILRNYKNIALSVFIGFILSTPWYILNQYYSKIFSYAMLPYSEIGPSFIPPFPSLIQYILSIFFLGVTPIGFFFFALAVFSLFYVKDKQSSILYMWILSSVIIFSTIHNVQLRYIMPILPAFALITLKGIRNFQLRLSLFALLFVIFISWLMPYPLLKIINPYNEAQIFDSSCNPSEWKIKEILMDFPENSNIAIIDRAFPLSDDYLNYIAKREHIPINVYNLRQPFMTKQTHDLDYFIYIGNQERSWPSQERMEYLYYRNELFIKFDEPLSTFTGLIDIEKKLIKTHQLPMNIVLYAYNITEYKN